MHMTRGRCPKYRYITLNLRVLADSMEGDNQTVTDIDALRVERITSREAMRLTSQLRCYSRFPA